MSEHPSQPALNALLAEVQSDLAQAELSEGKRDKPSSSPVANSLPQPTKLASKEAKLAQYGLTPGDVHLMNKSHLRDEGEVKTDSAQPKAQTAEDPFCFIRRDPANRMIMNLLVRGSTPAEIAAMSGYSEVQVQKIVSQEWFLQELQSVANEQQVEDLELHLRGFATIAINTIVTTMQTTTDGRLKFECAKDILSRVMVKPTTVKSLRQALPSDPRLAMDLLRAECESLEKQLKHQPK